MHLRHPPQILPLALHIIHPPAHRTHQHHPGQLAVGLILPRIVLILAGILLRRVHAQSAALFRVVSHEVIGEDLEFFPVLFDKPDAGLLLDLVFEALDGPLDDRKALELYMMQ